MADQDWDPDKENEALDLQRKQLELGRKFIAKIEADEAKQKAREEAALQNPEPVPHLSAADYTPPTFEEVSALLQKSWKEVEKIMPTACGEVKVQAFLSLVHAAGQGRYGE